VIFLREKNVDEVSPYVVSYVCGATIATNTCCCRLSQLRSVGYRRDVTLKDEREQRHSEQMRMLHPRGSGIVVDASYTLCKYLMVSDILVLTTVTMQSTVFWDMSCSLVELY
jgi:hypothetical protein